MEKPEEKTEGAEFNELKKYPDTERIQEIQNQLEKVEALLTRFLDADKTRELLSDLLDWVSEIDEAVERIKEDPAIDNHFIYDGKIFSPKSPVNPSYKLIDGLNFLKEINEETIRPYFSGAKYDIDGLMSWLYKTYVSSAKDSLRHFEKSGTPGLPEMQI